MSWIAHVKKYARDHNVSYGEALSLAKPSYRRKKTTTKTVKGNGVIQDVKKGLAVIADRIANPLKTARKLPAGIQKLVRKYNEFAITGIEVRRKPIYAVIDKVLNVLSLGTFDKAKKSMAYDKMFHLSLIFTFSNNKKLIYEKNERINISESIGGDQGAEYMSVDSRTASNIGEFIRRHVDYLGLDDYYTYDAFKNNCQRFVLSGLKANGLSTPALETFINQHAEEIVKQMPRYVDKISRLLTDIAARASELTGGKAGGRRVVKKQRSKRIMV